MEKLTILVVGCGSFGAHLAELIATLPQFQIVGLCDPEESKLEALAQSLDVAGSSSLRECLSDSEAQAVLLTAPNHLHHSLALEAAEAGKHIFCEKPMALDVEECHAMIESADRAGIKLMVGHKRRLRPQYQKMVEVVRSGRLGRVLAVNINGFYHRDWWGWWLKRKQGGGLLHASGVHDVDFLRYICGEAGSVFARSPVKTDHRSDYEDAISLMIHFESGAVGTLQVCPFSGVRTFREAFGVHIVLERGGVLYNPSDFSVSIQGWEGQEERFEFDNEAGFREAYTTELTSFADWVLEDREPILTGWDGLRCVEIMEAAYLSARCGREVQLPLPRHKAPSVILGPISQRHEPGEAELYARGLSMPEGPAFDREGYLFVANCRADFVSKISLAGEVSHFVTTGGKTQGVAIHPDGSLYITDHKHRKIFKSTPKGSLEVFCDRYQDGTPLRGPNEILFGPNGKIYFTDPGKAWRGRPGGRLSRVSEDGLAGVLADGLEFTNGLDFSPDGSRIYVVETTTGKVLTALLDREGSLVEGLIEFVHFAGRVGPDGIRVAANGDLYVTLFGHGQIAVISPSGEEIDRLQVPGLFPTNVIFRGTKLLVCEGQTGAIWTLDLGVEGVLSYAERVWLQEAQGGFP